MNIPPYITLIVGIILIIIVRTILNTHGIVPQFIQFFGVILVIVGSAGLIGKLFRKKDEENKSTSLETPVSKFKYSRYIAYVLSLIMIVLIVLNWHDLLPVFWPVIILFILTLIFNGGVGGKTIFERLPFYLALIGFIFWLVLIFLSF